MKRMVLALALVAVAAVACKKADQQGGQMAADTTKAMSDSTHMMMSDSAKTAGDTTKKRM